VQLLSIVLFTEETQCVTALLVIHGAAYLEGSLPHHAGSHSLRIWRDMRAKHILESSQSQERREALVSTPSFP
jgi:hypothetical protein